MFNLLVEVTLFRWSLSRFGSQRARRRKNNPGLSGVFSPNPDHFISELSPFRRQVAEFTGIFGQIVQLPIAASERLQKPEQLEIPLPHSAIPKQFPTHRRVILVDKRRLTTEHRQQGATTEWVDFSSFV